MAGRTPAISDEMLKFIKVGISHGLNNEKAARFAGIGEKSFYRYLQIGAVDRREGRVDTPYAQFHYTVEKAFAESELRDLQTITQFAMGFEVEKTKERIVIEDGVEKSRDVTTEKAMRREWQAAAWRLERRWPERWGRRFEQTAEGNAVASPVIYLPDNQRTRLPVPNEAVDDQPQASIRSVYEEET